MAYSLKEGDTHHIMDTLKIDVFKQELLSLMKKHHIRVCGYDNYDGEENYIGTRYVFNAPDGSGVDIEDFED